MNETFVRVIGKVRDIRNHKGEDIIILAGPHFVGKPVMREHVNVRMRDFKDDCKVIGKFAVGAEVEITCIMDRYVQNGEVKHCLTNITKIQRI